MARGTVVRALTNTGVVVGCAVVGEEGRYGFMMVYGAGAGSEDLQGMQTGESIRLQFGGMDVGETPYVWAADQDLHRFDVEFTGYRIHLPAVSRQE
jgi:hypothetical protein